MIALKDYNGKAVGVFGLGKAGAAAIAALRAGGATVYAWDDKEESRDAVIATQNDASVHVIHTGLWPWKQLAAVVLSPGIPLTHPVPHPVVQAAREARVPVVGEVELLYQACPHATYIGITGTNGKSTTTTLIHHILEQNGKKVQVGGNLGTPALALEPLGDNGIYVIEMSSYQLDLIRTARFNIGVLLNITPDHIDRHGDIKGYIKAKMRLFMNQQKGDWAVIAVDDDYTRKIAQDLRQTGNAVVLTASTTETKADVNVTNGRLSDGVDAAEIGHIPSLQGRHNWQNAAVAWEVARHLNIAPVAISRAMENFGGLAHRLERIAEKNGVLFVNDSKATNADATQHALAAYDNIYWILGGKSKDGGITTLASFFPRVKHAFLIGAAENEFAQTLEGKVPFTRCGTLENATKAAADMAAKAGQGVVLLSPACASFDQWKSFEQRGDAFREYAKHWIK